MVLLVTFFINPLYANQKRYSSWDFSNVSSYSPIEMHYAIVRLINADISYFVAARSFVRTTIINIDAHAGHIYTIPITRAVERHGFNIVIILNREFFE